MILFGEAHLHYVLKRIEWRHNAQRPHQGLGNEVPTGFGYPEDPVPPDNVECEPALGGLLNHYHAEKAA